MGPPGPAGPTSAYQGSRLAAPWVGVEYPADRRRLSRGDFDRGDSESFPGVELHSSWVDTLRLTAERDPGIALGSIPVDFQAGLSRRIVGRAYIPFPLFKDTLGNLPAVGACTLSH